MQFIDEIRQLCNDNKNKKIGLFIDMDGVVADFDIYTYNDIRNNTPYAFLKKRPIKTVIKVLEKLNEISNLEVYVLSACLFKNQAKDKSTWLDFHLPFIQKGNRYFIIKEVVNYNIKTKPSIKTGEIKTVMDKDKLDIAIYIEDEHEMIREARKIYKDNVICYHVSSLID